MEAQSGAEVRRLHIVYFLSRKGSIEHPHLIRVHHLCRNGVRLRDVKRWLGELRGKDVPESFSWSYKRKYKTGYVWQDLLDDDLITPISDNEYVLKGSELSSTYKVGKQKSHEDQKTACKEENQSHTSETSVYVSRKSSSEIEEESPTFGSDTSTLTDDSARLDTEKNPQTTTIKQEKPACDDAIKQSSTSYFTFLGKKNKKSCKKVKSDEKNSKESRGDAAVDPPKISSSEQQPQSTKSKNHSMIRNLICGEVGTNDSVKTINKPNKPCLNMCSSDPGSVHSAAACRKEGFGGSQRIFGNPNWTQHQWSSRNSFDGIKGSSKSEARDQREALAAFKPVNGPYCSQCGKTFKPEKLHGHMKSCKGMKTMSKCGAAVSAAASEKASKGSMAVSAHLLTH